MTAFERAAMGAAPLPSAEHLRDILRSGIQAPSAENKHWLRFEFASDRVRLVSLDTPTWSTQPHRETLARISHAAVIENMALRSLVLGYAQTTRWLPDAAPGGPLAECRWAPSAQAPDPLAEAIGQRHTNRRFYERRAVPAVTLARLADAASAVPGATLRWLAEPSARSLALTAMWRAEAERFCRPALHHELFSAVRFDLGWQRSATEGLPPGALEVEPPMRAPFAALRHWRLMRTLSWLGMHHLLGARAAYLPCKLAPHIGLLLCDVEAPAQAALHAGRALQRVWLAATREGLAFQPMAAAIALSRQRAGGGWVSPPVQRRVRDALSQLSAGRPDSIFMLLRIGYAAAPSVVTERAPIEQFLTGA